VPEGTEGGGVMGFTKANAAAMGQRGGNATVEKHGREHMAEIGKLGMAALYVKLEAAATSERSKANIVVWITNMVHKKRRAQKRKEGNSLKAKMIEQRGYWNREGPGKRRRPDPMTADVPF
jgi:hypothetical protein